MPERPAVVFDLDGTMITCANRQTALARACAAARGLQLDPHEFWSAKRAGATTREAVSAQGARPGLASAISRAWRDAIETPYWLGLDQPFNDVHAVLKSLGTAGRRRILLTARARPHWLHVQLARLELPTLLDDIIAVPPDRAVESKADALRVLRPVGFIGDSESDAEAALRSRTPFVALHRGQRNAAFLHAAGVRTVVPDLAAARTALGV